MLYEQFPVEEKKYICVLLRDKLYLDKTLPNGGDASNNIRNMPTNILNKAVEYISSEGMKTVRIGQAIEDNLDLPGYIEHCQKGYDEFVDIMLHRQCKFTFGNLSGGMLLSTFMGTPVALLSDMYPFLMPLSGYKTTDLIMFRKMKEYATGRVLTFKENLTYYCKFQIEHRRSVRV